MNSSSLFYGYGAHRDLLSFPTRRSSDLVDEDGIDLELLKEVKEVRRGRLGDYTEQRGEPRTEGSIWDEPCDIRSEEHTSELQSRPYLVCRILLEKKVDKNNSVPLIPAFT